MPKDEPVANPRVHHKNVVPFAEIRVLVEMSARQFERQLFLSFTSYNRGKCQLAGVFRDRRYFAIVSVRVLFYSHKRLPAPKDWKHFFVRRPCLLAEKYPSITHVQMLACFCPAGRCLECGLAWRSAERLTLTMDLVELFKTPGLAATITAITAVGSAYLTHGFGSATG
jgi:hypothetical protein